MFCLIGVHYWKIIFNFNFSKEKENSIIMSKRVEKQHIHKVLSSENNKIRKTLA